MFYVARTVLLLMRISWTFVFLGIWELEDNKVLSLPLKGVSQAEVIAESPAELLLLPLSIWPL